MKKVTLTRPVTFLVASLALAGLLLTQPKPAFTQATFGLADAQGRYISAENAYDTSSVHAFAAPNASIVGPPIFFSTAEVMVADGNGNVCGESDGFYSGISAPGVNLGPSLYHGTYTVEADTGRITIETVSDGAPSPANKFCGTSTAISPSTVTKTQVGYLQGKGATKIATVEQVFGNPNLSPGFLSHRRVWTKMAQPFPPGPPPNTGNDNNGDDKNKD
jgi:hypothetical protein